jgi:hypothetical protein
MQHVGIVTVPEDYLERITTVYPAAYSALRLFGLEGHDLALSKLERNSARDREDVKYLARTIPLDLGLLERRYRLELRPYLAHEERHDLTTALDRNVVPALRSVLVSTPDEELVLTMSMNSANACAFPVRLVLPIRPFSYTPA